MITLKDIGQCLSIDCDNPTAVDGFSIDSRSLRPGEVFLACKGEKVDGHQFMDDAQSKGAVAVINQQASSTLSIPQFTIENVETALGDIAKAYKTNLYIPTIALTGSNGKTTVKEMIANCLPQPSLATEGNLNNHLGVPIMVAKLRPEHRFAVFELGANHLGEIAYTAAICQPDVALVNNIGPAHIAEFGSIENVARTKGEIYQQLPPSGTAVINDDDDYAHFWDASLIGRRTIRFSKTHRADCFATAISYTEQSCAQFQLTFPCNTVKALTLSVPGEHMISNALAAASCLWAIGIDCQTIIDGLSAFQGVAGRQFQYKGQYGSCIIDDSYNANLRSSMAALQLLSRRKGKRIMVFGDMGELGDQSPDHHRKVGLHARDLGIDQLFTVGKDSAYAQQAFGQGAQHFQNKQDLIKSLQQQLDQETIVLVKGSRAARMETIVNALTQPSTTH